MLTRKNEIIIGVLFLLATASYMVGSALIEANVAQFASVSQLVSNRMEMYVGLFLELFNCAAVVAIAVLLFPLLKQHSGGIALGYVSSRVIEAVLLTVGVMSPLLLLYLNEAYILVDGNQSANDTYDSVMSILGVLLVHGQKMSFQLAMAALGIGSVFFCWLLYRKDLIPKLLSLLGIVGYIALTLSSCLSIIGYDPGMFLFIPGGLFEIIFPVWLIVKGFKR